MCHSLKLLHMKTIVTVLALILSLGLANAQDFKGVATYQTKTTLDMSGFGGREMSEQMRKQMAERMKSMLEKTYTLSFNKSESIYEEEEKLEAPGAGGGMRFMGGGFSQGGVYKNVAENLYARENELMGKTFLIQDSLKTYDWKLEKESKMIGSYAAFKATAVVPVDNESLMRFRRRGEEEDSTATKAPKDQVVTVWYTPQVPINQGPADYWGLPGLILEVQAGNTVIICNKIVLNPKEEITIDKPKKGEKVSRAAYEKIVLEKTQEMRERYSGGRGGFRGRG